MALEIPEDLIKRVQISLRREANLASYNPDDTSLPNLPSLQQTLSQLDPSPPYLRCKHCKARLLRGIQSLICVFCGRHHHLDPIPDPLVFRNTFACRWFLDSLDLDGSETVGPSIRANESNRGQSAAKDEFPLSDLLDLEIRWSAESEKVGTSYVLNETPIQGKNVLNLAEVDLDNFFDDGKGDVASSSSQVSNKQIGSTESKDFQVSANLNLFKNVQQSETATRSMESKSGDSFSGWEANFQSANAGTYREETKPFDPFLGSAGDSSAHMGAVFGTGKDATDGKGDDNTLPSASMNNDLFQDDLWTNSSSGIIGQTERVEMTANVKDGVITENVNISSSMNVDWLQVDLLQSNNKKAPDVKTTKEDDDPFEAWNDFTSSTSAQDPFHGPLKQTVNKATPSAEQTSEINLFGSVNNSQDIDFGSFSQQDLFSGADSNQYGSPEVHNNPSESFISDRMPNTNPTVEGDAEDVTTGGDVSSVRTRSNVDDVEKIMSQMHDLSFMLDGNLSIPQKR